MSEATRIADQLTRALHGAAWHGPSLLEILDGVTADEAGQHPIGSAHSIAELVQHVTAWIAAAERALDGDAAILQGEADWPPVPTTREWDAAVANMRTAAERLAARVSALPDSDLTKRIRGVDQEYSVYALLHGVVQHNLYHAGQMALLKKAVRNGAGEPRR